MRAGTLAELPGIDNASYDPRMLLDLVGGGLFAADPFMLVDVGCGLGSTRHGGSSGPALQAHAFDPQVQEIERLAREEENPNVHYHAALVGLPDAPPPPLDDACFNPFGRTSSMQAITGATAVGGTPFYGRTTGRVRS